MPLTSLSASLVLGRKAGGGIGLRFGTGMGAVFDFLSGGGSGVPGGGNGRPRPIIIG
jgi:hypothetical protein